MDITQLLLSLVTVLPTVQSVSQFSHVLCIDLKLDL